jgi:hypothetical protein
MQVVPDEAGARAFCTSLLDALCEHEFGDCPGAVQPFVYPVPSSLADCRAIAAATCLAQPLGDAWYDPGCGEVCVALARASSCETIHEWPSTQACRAAEGSFPPAPGGTLVLPQTITDAISSTDPVYYESFMMDVVGYSRTYGVALTAGQGVSIQTAPPAFGSGIGDTELYLVGPEGAQPIANDDDIDWSAGNYYSAISLTVPITGDYRIVVRGQSASDSGGYELSVR